MLIFLLNEPVIDLVVQRLVGLGAHEDNRLVVLLAEASERDLIFGQRWLHHDDEAIESEECILAGIVLYQCFKVLTVYAKYSADGNCSVPLPGMSNRLTWTSCRSHS